MEDVPTWKDVVKMIVPVDGLVLLVTLEVIRNKQRSDAIIFQIHSSIQSTSLMQTVRLAMAVVVVLRTVFLIQAM